MSTWGTIQSELQKVVDDASFDTAGTNVTYLLTWANRIVDDVIADVDIRYHLTSATVTAFTTSDYYKALPTDWHKPSDRFTVIRRSDADDYIELITLEELNDLNPYHDDVTTNTYPDYCAIEGPYIYVYPMFAGDIYMQNYYKRATAMTSTADSPDLPYVYMVDDLIVFGVASKFAFPLLNEPELASEYKAKYEDALNRYMRHLDKNNSRKVNEMVYY